MQRRTGLWLAIATGTFAQNVDFASDIPWRQTETQPGVHDPSVIRDERGVYTLLSTNNLLAVMQSTDMTNWTPKGRLLNGVPGWMTSVYPSIENIWAPHVAKMGGKYWVYYCGSVFGKNTSLIGAMWSLTLDVASPEYKWTDIGEVWRSTTVNDYNAIDPELLVDASGKAWLSFGSFWQGLRMIAIDPATGKQSATNRTLYMAASRGGGGIEGPSTIQHGQWFYLFAPFDKCCDGVNSTYRTMYGRSANPYGPFLDESGKDMANGGGTLLIGTNGRYVGPGGGSPFQDGRRDYFALHYYDRNRNGASFLQMREIVYGDDGWIDFGHPFLGRHLALEAEHAVLTGAAILQGQGTAASDNEYVGNINTDNSGVEFLTNIIQAGSYQVVVRFAAGDGTASHKLSINGGTPTTISYPRTSAWGTFPSAQVVVVNADLKKGRNSLKFTKGDGFAELDRIDIVRKADSKLSLGAFDRSSNASWDSLHDDLVLGPQASTIYENLGFGDGGFKFVELCGSSGNGRIRMSLGNGLSQEMAAAEGCKIHDLAAPLLSTKGIHDLVLTNLSGSLVLESIRFLSNSSGAVARKRASRRPDGNRRVDIVGRDRSIAPSTIHQLPFTKDFQP